MSMATTMSLPAQQQPHHGRNAVVSSTNQVPRKSQSDSGTSQSSSSAGGGSSPTPPSHKLSHSSSPSSAAGSGSGPTNPPPPPPPPPPPAAAAAASSHHGHRPLDDGGSSSDRRHSNPTAAAASATISPERGDNDDLLSVSFNQDYGCFACGTNNGFRIYNCEPFKETFRREFADGGIGMVEMLFRSNIMAVVGGGKTPRYPPNKAMIWDDHESRCLGELSFRSEVRAVRLRRDRIVVVLEHKIYVYNFEDLKLLHQIDTITNQKGLCCLSPSSTSIVLACPGLHKGQVRVELYDTKRTRFIAAHDSALACFALTLDGTRLATASVKGTLIRIFNTADGSKPVSYTHLDVEAGERGKGGKGGRGGPRTIRDRRADGSVEKAGKVGKGGTGGAKAECEAAELVIVVKRREKWSAKQRRESG
ncbi:hypothetical protein CBR_g78886 [Chara braunii]|uniref:WD repeat domain phosphoinositide-interacting protein 3 n=1 Tax=Chara braunii TaxID=69332 RepID=A0A388KAL4_CHABU|nr:hypothetical protein CBR_g78886 [Chara braunii]|eukprot:GBG67105.1 hypothetical protein CBR_g78886 [Chara braunii]